MTKKSDAPAIRFKGFSDAWEQRKVGEVSESYSGGTPSVGVKEYYGGQIPFIRSAEINSEITELFLTGEGLKNSSARLVAVGDILYALYGATSGEVGRARLKGAINQAILAIKPHTDYDSEYLAQWLRKSKHSIIETYLQGGQGNLSGTIVKELSVGFPSLKEQKAIGDFFRQLDNLITLHQRKCALLFNSFQALISMMFTTSTFSWEQRKVGDLLIERNQQAPMSDEYPLMAFIANEGVAPKGERYDRSALVTDTVNKLYKKTEKGDFIYSSNNLETGSIGLNKYGKACISPVYSIFEPTGIADSDFLGRRLVRKDFINAMVKWRQGVIYGQWRIHESDFLKIEIPVPSVEEQRKIGAYLDQLDNLITLHQRKGKAAVTGCSNDANNSKGVYCKARDFGYKCYKKVKSQQIRCLIAVFIFFV